MSERAVEAILQRALEDEAFRARLAADPRAALAEYDLSDAERALFASGTAGAERLEERMSKTDLSSPLAVKTASPVLPPARKRGG